MKHLTSGAAILLALCTTACTTVQYDRYGFPRDASPGGKSYDYALRVPPMDPNRRVVELDCSNSYTTDGGNLRCIY